MDAWGGMGGRRGQDGQLEGTDNRTAEEERLEEFFIFWVRFTIKLSWRISPSVGGKFLIWWDPSEVVVKQGSTTDLDILKDLRIRTRWTIWSSGP